MSTDSPSRRSLSSAKPGLRTLPPLPVAASLETVSSLKAVIPARAALAGFTQALQQSSLDSAALFSFALLDSVAALQLEGDVVDMRSALQSCGITPLSLSRHVAARHQAHKRVSAEPVGSTLALELASHLQGAPVSVRRASMKHASALLLDPHYAQLSPPQGAERLQVLLEDWQTFVQHRAGDLDPLLMTAAAHGQWMALRPFTEANIATGQLLTSLLLCEEDLLPLPALPLALYFSRHAERYWESLYQAIAFGEHAGWIRFFMAAVVEASHEATGQLMDWERHLRQLRLSLDEHLPKTPSVELVLTCARPSFGMADLAICGLNRRQTAASWMQKLVSAGILLEDRVGKEKRYINKAVMELLLR